MEEMQKVLEIMATLRGENGCNWDKRQTHESLIPHLLEETYEVVDALHSLNDENLKEELGDLLFQIVFHCQIASETKRFTFKDVANTLSEKLISRHPHIFQEQKNLSAEEVLNNWENLKAKEKESKGILQESVLDGIPKSLPALQRAEKLQTKAAKVGFDWSNPKEIIKKIYEELNELEKELDNPNPSKKRIVDELGDVIFSVVNLSRFLNLSSELVLRYANEKFESRFRKMEIIAKEQKQTLEKLSLEEMENLWKISKEQEKVSLPMNGAS